MERSREEGRSRCRPEITTDKWGGGSIRGNVLSLCRLVKVEKPRPSQQVNRVKACLVLVKTLHTVVRAWVPSRLVGGNNPLIL